MSNDMTGADLEQLEQLAKAYTDTGAALAEKAGALRTRIAAAVSTFTSSMDRLVTATTTMSDDVELQVSGVTTTAAGVAWTGQNRRAFDTDLDTFATAVRAGAGAIATGAADLRAAVTGRFTPVLEQFATSVTAAADGADTTAADMTNAIGTQRSALADTADVGWTAV